MADEAGRIESALARLTERLDDVAAAVQRLASPAATGELGQPLDEATRTTLEPLARLLIGTGEAGAAAAEAALLAEATRVGLADRAALWRSRPAPARLIESPPSPGAPSAGEPAGLAARALGLGEVIAGGPDDQARDPWMSRHGLTRAVALPVRDAADRPAGVLLVGRRRDVPFDALRLGWLLVLAERMSAAPAPAHDAPPERAPEMRPQIQPEIRPAIVPPAQPEIRTDLPPAGRDIPPLPGATSLLQPAGATMGEPWALDLGRVSEQILRRVAEAAPTPVVVLLAPGPRGIDVLAARGLPDGHRLAPPAGLGAVLGSGQLVTDDALGERPDLAAWLGAPPRLVAPLATPEATAGFLVLGGPAPANLGPLVALLPAAAVALRNARLHAATRAALAERQERPPAAVGPPPAPARDFGALLALVLGRLGFLRERPGLDLEVQRDLEVVEEAAWRAAEAVRDVLGYGRDRAAEALAPVDPGEVLATVVRRAQSRREHDAAATAVTLDVEPLPPVRGSAVELVEALEHLLDNAVEAAGPGGTVTVRGRWDGGGLVELSVSDDGPGMDETVRTRAVEPFFSTRRPGRIGLGLSIAQAIVARHRGELELVSALDQGTTARLRLPILAADGREPAVPEPPPAARVLVVEDDAAVRQALVGIVGQLGHVALTAADGAEALARLGGEEVTAVVTDLALPGGSGLEVAREVQRLKPGTPVIVVTAWPGRLDPASLADTGVAAVVEKPVGAAELGSALARVLGVRPEPAR